MQADISHSKDIISDGKYDYHGKVFKHTLSPEMFSNPTQNLIFDDNTNLKAIFVGQIDFNSITKNFEEILLQFKAYRESDL